MAMSTGTDTQQGTSVLVYAPTIEAYINTEKNGTINVSADINRAQIKRVENGVSQAMLQLDNSKGKYGYQGAAQIQRMDKIIIYLKRVTRIQVFSGYLDSIPFLDLYPTTCTIQASCTLKRLLYMYWDPGLTPSQQILDQNQYTASQTAGAPPAQGAVTAAQPNTLNTSSLLTGPDASNHTTGAQIGSTASAVQSTAAATANGTKTPSNPVPSTSTLDSGLGAMLINVLVKVGGWNKDAIKVQNFPTDFLKFSIATIENQDYYLQAVQQLQQLLGFDAGSGTGASGAFDGGIPTTAGVFGGKPWNAEQLGNANIIAGVGKSLGITKNGIIEGLMCAMQESSLINKCTATDHDSVGLFQQRPSQDWGTVQQCCDPPHAAQSFFNKLKQKVPNYDTARKGDAIQTVQISGFPRAYDQWEASATALVNAGAPTATGAGAVAPTPAPTGGGQVAVPAGLFTQPSSGTTTTLPGQTVGTPAAPGAAAAVYAADGVHPTSPDKMAADKAIAFALAQVGKPYVWGSTGPNSWDCSGLTQAACRAGGVNITRTTATQINDGTDVKGQLLQPGNLILPTNEHVIMYIGNGQIVEAPEPGKNVRRGRNYATNPYGVRQVMPPGDAAPADAQGSGDTGSGGANATGTAATPPFAYGLFNVMFDTGAFYSDASYSLTDDRAIINDQQLMQIIQSICKASLRNFCSAPDGQFMAYYPDYFGIHKTVAVRLRDIEMKNVSIQLSDASVTTHVFTPGEEYSYNGQQSSGATAYLQYMSTQGIATVEDADLFKMMLNIDPKVDKDYSADAIYKRFGARPLLAVMPMIRNPVMERLQAIILFMQKWAEQYQTRVEVTFMPEVFPGMRVELTGHNLNVYVKEVTHSIDMESGFKTDLVIMSPSTNRNGLPGLPVSKGT